MKNNYDILSYPHKNDNPKILSNLRDPDFKRQLILSYKGNKFDLNKYILFQKHCRNINLHLKKIENSRNRVYNRLCIENSLVYMYNNYLNSFVDTVVSGYFRATIDTKKQTILNDIVGEIYNSGRVANNEY